MSTITTFATTSVAKITVDSLNKAYVLKNRLDFSKTNVLAADVVQALSIPANTMVMDVLVKVVTAEGATCTATVGDGSGANSWDASTNLNATAGTITQAAVGTDAYAASAARGKVYTSADTIDLTMGHNTDTAVIDVIAICFDLN